MILLIIQADQGEGGMRMMINLTTQGNLRNHFADQVYRRRGYIKRRQHFSSVGITELKCKSSKLEIVQVVEDQGNCFKKFTTALSLSSTFWT